MKIWRNHDQSNKIIRLLRAAILTFAITIAPLSLYSESVQDATSETVPTKVKLSYCVDEREEEFRIIERWYSENPRLLTIGIANIRNCAPFDEKSILVADTIERNKKRILRAVDIFKKLKVNMILFPEYCLTGYFWDMPNSRPVDSKGLKACWTYMAKGALNDHKDWLKQIQDRLDDTLRYVVITNIRKGDAARPAGPKNKFFNSALVIDRFFNCDDLYCPWNEKNRIYDKTKLPGIEKTYLRSGIDDYLVVNTGRWGRFGVTICYDMCFSQMYMEYAMTDRVDFILETASWRGTGGDNYGKENYGSMRDHAGNPIIDDYTYGYQWDVMAASRAATNQVWFVACNATGNQEMHLAKPGLRVLYEFWGGSGLWAPSGKPLLQASRNLGHTAEILDELMIIHNIDIQGGVAIARKIYGDYFQDFRYYRSPVRTMPGRESQIIEIYRPIPGARAHTRMRSMEFK
jgi:predicted amidohydrolase